MNNILDFWFQNGYEDTMQTFWFDKSKDQYITENYKDFVDTITIENYKDYIKDKYDIIKLLIIGDQFTRNIYRNDDRTKNDIWALELALDIINNNKDLDYQLNYRYFILLPLRHNKNSKLLDIVCSRIKLYFINYPESKTLKKFLKNTIQNYSDLVDTIKIGQNIENYDESILEKYNKLSNNISFDYIYNTCKKYKSVGISLSGGVDSMVLLHVLKYNKINVIAIHIEYCNRIEAKQEREFLEYYCNKIGVKLYYRTIDYIDRTNRELFETETRKARFNLYKYVIDKERLEGICLGHHLGDIVENVFTNIIKGRSVNDITVMEKRQEQNNVTLFRPFLNLKKDDLLLMAHNVGVPYFLNSTPSWSCRGVLRDKIIPILKEQFGDFEHNISKFTESCSLYTNFYNKHNIIKEIKSDYCIKIEYVPELTNKSEQLLLNIMHSNGYHMVSHKLINNFILWLNTNKNNQFELGKNMFCYYKNNYLHFINYTKILNEMPSKEILMKEFDIPPKIKMLYKF